MIYTGYYAQLKKYIAAGLTPVSIAGKAPAFYNGIEYKKLAPKYDFFSAWKRGEIDNFEYTTRFNKEVLGNLNPHAIIEELTSLAGENIVLLCYEKQGDFCHRHIVADWLETTGKKIDEYQVVDINKKV